MSIASELTNLEGNIEDSYDAVNDMGGIIPAQRNMDNLDQAIRTIPQNQGTTYTAGTGIDITSDVISVDNTTVPYFSDLATVATTGDYGDLLNTPTIPTDTSDLTNDGDDGVHPFLATDDVATVATTGAYSDLSGTPSLATVATSGSYNDLSNKPTIPAAQVNSDWNANSGVEQILNKPTLATVATTGAYSDLSGTPTIPTKTSDLTNDGADNTSTYVEADELSAVATSGSYNDLINTPAIPAAQIQSDWNQATTTAVDYIKNKPTIPAAQVNSDWNANSGVAQILNKPTIITPLDIYPVGAIYMSVNNTNPGTLFGGTWEQIKDRFILAAGTTYAGGSTGGAATINLSHSHTVNSHNHSLPANTGSHTLTTSEMPSHSHDTISMSGQTLYTANNVTSYVGGHSAVRANYSDSSWERKMSTNSVGGGGGHSHTIGGNTGNASPGTNSQLSSTQSVLPPYLAVYVWKRTA